MRGSPLTLFCISIGAICACSGAKEKREARPASPAGGAPAAGPEAALPWSAPDASIGILNPKLYDLLDRYWSWSLEQEPRTATQLGVHAFDDRIEDDSLTAIQKRRAARRRFLDEAWKIVREMPLEPPDEVTATLLIDRLETDIALEVCQFEEWNVSARHNPVVEWNMLPEIHRVATSTDARNLVSRYRRVAGHVDQHVINLRRGAGKGLYPNADTTRLVIQLVKNQLAEPLESWALVLPAKADVPGWSPADLTRFRDELRRIVLAEIKPALVRYLDLLEKEILPGARGEDEVGLSALAGGEACYAALIRRHTTLNQPAAELHRIGTEEIKRVNQEMRELGAKLFDVTELDKTLERLRSDEKLFFGDAEEIVQKADKALALARSKLDAYFNLKPRADCVIRRIPQYEAPFTTIAYYRAPVPDGTKPGEYFVNVHQPKTRPRFEAEVLAFHEAIPGHHLQIAIAQELPATPAFRRHLGINAFVEGWALYTERLADEMGLYSTDLDRMGMLSYDAWRAARLVVDTGIHTMGWTREEAVRYMLAHTALAENNIRNEVDRYITSPGQALSYKTGQLEIRRLRRWAEQELGKKFDIRSFHDVVLGSGAVSLSILERRVKAWVASRR